MKAKPFTRGAKLNQSAAYLVLDALESAECEIAVYVRGLEAGFKLIDPRRTVKDLRALLRKINRAVEVIAKSEVKS